MGKKRQKIKGRFVPVPYALIESDAWKKLSGNSIKVYLVICKCNWQSKNAGTEFIIPYSYYKDKIFVSKPVFYKSLKELCENGFLERTEYGGLYKNSSKYKFSQLWATTFNKPFQSNIKLQNKNKAWAGITNNKERVIHGISIQGKRFFT